MDEKTRELMQRLIDEKRRKSASQSGIQRSPGSLGSPQPGRKKHKKGGLFDK